MIAWVDTVKSRGSRHRQAPGEVPSALPLIDSDHTTLLTRWASNDGERRSRATLLKDSKGIGIERAEALCELLLREGWIVRSEQLSGGAWHWEWITWRDLPRLQRLLSVSGPRQRLEQRQDMLSAARSWVQSRSSSDTAGVVDPDLQDELERCAASLGEDSSVRLDLLELRLGLLRSLATWHDEGREGSRRDFALHARGTTKALSDADWRWLESSFDLERLRVFRFVPVAWIAGDFELIWDDHRAQLAPLHCVGLPLADLQRARGGSPPARWWLIENRASFERQAMNRPADIALIWMPGRPSKPWMDAIAHLLEMAPAPAWISADADPAGVDIACGVGSIWEAHGLAWEPHRMGVSEWAVTTQRWPLNEHDHRMLESLLARSEIPALLRELCEAMKREDRKAEQEAWI